MANPAKSETSAEEQSKYQPPPSVQPVEPEELSQTSGHQQEQRETLHHNAEGKQAQRHPESVPAQHSTGSFTDDKNGK